MPATYEPIATTTLGSAAASITFSSIPSTYTDLRLVLNHLSAGSSGVFPIINFNGDTTSSTYSNTKLIGNGSTASSSRDTSNTYIDTGSSFGASTTIPFMISIDIFSYTASVNKTCLISLRGDKNGSGTVINEVGLWSNTSAITSITLGKIVDNYGTGTTATLYGILKA